MTLGRRIVVTGLGAVCALGADAAQTWEAVRAGRSGIAPHLFDAGPHGPEPVTLPGAFPPQVQIWTASKMPWLALDEDLPHFTAGPP